MKKMIMMIMITIIICNGRVKSIQFMLAVKREKFMFNCRSWFTEHKSQKT